MPPLPPAFLLQAAAGRSVAAGRLLAGRLLAGGLLACKAAASLMGGVGPATDRSRCRRVCANFLFFYKKSMLIFHHV
jgi:hypothetical protein